MFLTFDKAELKDPPELSPPGHTRWRLFESVGGGFFIVAFRLRDEPPASRHTAMMCWDSDVVHLIENRKLGATFYSLHHVSPAGDAASQSLIIREVGEIWRGTDHEALGSEILIFKTLDGSEFCGPESIPVPPSVERLALIATFGQKSGPRRPLQ